MTLLAAALVALTTSVAAAAPPLSVAVRGQYLSPSDAAFKDIYGGGLLYGGELGLGVGRRLDLWAGAGRLARSGALSFTGEPATMAFVRVAAGVRYRLSAGPTIVYAAAGPAYYRFHESSPLGEVRHGGAGLTGRVGALLPLGRRLRLDVGAGYSYCRMKPGELALNLGGLEAGAGLVIQF